MNEMMNLMIDSAEKQGLWMFCQYQALWFSPQELRKAQSEGRFRWGPVNWEVRDPQERMAELERGITSAIKDRDDFAKRLSLNPEGLRSPRFGGDKQHPVVGGPNP